MCIRDRQKTVKKLEDAYNFVKDVAASGKSVLFVGTKKQAQEAIDVYKRQVFIFIIVLLSLLFHGVQFL